MARQGNPHAKGERLVDAGLLFFATRLFPQAAAKKLA